MKIILKNLWKSVKRSTEGGFTLLEALFSFSLFCITVSLLPPLFSMMFHGQSDVLFDGRIQQMEWEHFACQLKKEVQGAERLDVTEGKITLTSGEETVTFQKYGALIRRQVNHSGHEVVLQNVKDVKFLPGDGYFSIHVRDTFGQEHMAMIYRFIHEEPLEEEAIE